MDIKTGITEKCIDLIAQRGQRIGRKYEGNTHQFNFTTGASLMFRVLVLDKSTRQQNTYN